MESDLSVLIVSYNTRELLSRCLVQLEAAAADLSLDIIVIDNGSTDGSVPFLLERQPPVRLLQSGGNAGFAAANNRGLAVARGPIVLLLNSDAFVTTAAIDKALNLFRMQPRVGMVGVRLNNADGTLQAGPGAFPRLWDDIRTALGVERILARRPRLDAAASGPVDWVQGACLFVRAEAVRTVGMLDESFFMYSEEVDWCRRFRAGGWDIWYLADTPVVHLGGASADSDLKRRVALYRSRLGLRRRWSGPAGSLVLWGCTLAGLLARVLGRLLAEQMTRRRLGRHAAHADWLLLRAVARMDPLARWAGR